MNKTSQHSAVNQAFGSGGHRDGCLESWTRKYCVIVLWMDCHGHGEILRSLDDSDGFSVAFGTMFGTMFGIWNPR